MRTPAERNFFTSGRLYGGFIAAYFLLLAHDGLKAYFTADDVMNFYRGWAIPLIQLWKTILLYYSTESRPLPGLVYRTIYFFAGFHPFPYRLFCFTLILINLFLLYRFARRLTGSVEIARMAVLLTAYHAWLVDIYFNTSALEELACFFFFFSALNYYLRIRQAGRKPSLGQLAALCLLFICALDSKETAVTLPLFIGLYELLYSPPKITSWRGPLALGAVSLPFLLARLGGGLVATHPLYRLDVSPLRYLHAFHLYLNVLFYQDHFFADAQTLELLASMAIVTWLLHRKYPHLLFCYSFVLLSVLPFIFISHYSGFFLYLPMAGWAIYIATLLNAVRALIPTSLDHPLSDAITFLAVAALLFPFHLSERRTTTRLYLSAQPPIVEFVQALDRLHVNLPKGSRILVLHNPFKPDDYTLLFTVSLYYADPTLIVDRTPRFATYDRIFDYRDGRLVQVKCGPLASAR